MDAPIVSFVDLWKAFGKNVIYEGLHLDVRQGEVLTILGGSGTGKSVLLKCLLRLLVPDRGHIYAFGEEVTGRSERGMGAIRRRIGMLFQGAALFDSMSVFDNVAYPMREGGQKEGAIRARVDEVLDLLDVAEARDKSPAELSDGTKKRVGLARTIAMSPEVILYDEPTTGLDPANVRMVDDLVLSMQQKLGVTSIVVTHDMESAFRISDRIAMLYDRRIVWVGDADKIEHAEHPIVRAFIEGDIGEDV